MAKTKEKSKILTSPKGRAFFPKLNEPDEYRGKLSYNTGLILERDDPEAKKFIEAIEKAHADAYTTAVAEAETPKAKKKLKQGEDSPVRPYEDKDGNEDEDRVVVRFKMAAAGEKNGKKWERKLPLFDALGKPFPKGKTIGGGSTIRCAYTISPYVLETGVCGVTLRLEAVKVIDLVEYGGARSHSEYGFEEEEGFDASTVSTEDTDDTSDDGGDDADGSDDTDASDI